MLVTLSNPCKLTNIEIRQYFESLAITLAVIVWTSYLLIQLVQYYAKVTQAKRANFLFFVLTNFHRNLV